MKKQAANREPAFFVSEGNEPLPGEDFGQAFTVMPERLRP